MYNQDDIIRVMFISMVKYYSAHAAYDTYYADYA